MTGSPNKGRKIVVVVRKVAASGGHHGGSWKVAYADFVTAMMAFFLVMWILGMDQDMRKAVQGYFANPTGVKKGGGAGKSPISTGAEPVSLQQNNMVMLPRRFEEQSFEKMGRELRANAREIGFDSTSGAQVETVVTDEGLRINLSEDGAGDALFAIGSPRMTPAMRRVLASTAVRLAALPNAVVVEGHTDRFSFGGSPGAPYGNWELSAERANAARRELERGGVAPARVVGVRGMADRALRLPDAPFDPHNRRISILVLFRSPVTAGDSGSVANQPRLHAGAHGDSTLP